MADFSLKIPIKFFPQDMRRDLSKIGDRHSRTTLEAQEIDADRDGYLDCKFHRNDRQFVEWQNALFGKRLIHRVFQPQGGRCVTPEIDPLEYAYMHWEWPTGESPKVWVYFTSSKAAQDFQEEQGFRGSIDPVPQERVEKKPNNVFIDEVDLVRELPLNHSDHVDELNRPREGTASEYFRVDIFSLLKIPGAILAKLNTPGLQKSNCFNSSMVWTGSLPDFRYSDGKELRQILDKSGHYREVQDAKIGDLVLWTSTRGEVVHTYIDLGHGWAFSKNGYEATQPFRFQRLEYIRHMYEQSTIEYDGPRSFPVLRELRYRRVAPRVKGFALSKELADKHGLPRRFKVKFRDSLHRGLFNPRWDKLKLVDARGILHEGAQLWEVLGLKIPSRKWPLKKIEEELEFLAWTLQAAQDGDWPWFRRLRSHLPVASQRLVAERWNEIEALAYETAMARLRELAKYEEALGKAYYAERMAQTTREYQSLQN